MRPDATRDAGLRELGVHERLQRITYGANGVPRPYEERKRLFDEYKVELKKRRNRLAHELHPDRNMDLPEAERDAKQQRFNRVHRAINFVLDLEVQPPPASAPVMRVAAITSWPTGGAGHFDGTNTTTTTSTAGFWPDIIT